MHMIRKGDKWIVEWIAHRHQANQAADWCKENFGEWWGDYDQGTVGTTGIGTHTYTFHLLSHAQWFQLKWTAWS